MSSFLVQRAGNCNKVRPNGRAFCNKVRGVYLIYLQKQPLNQLPSNPGSHRGRRHYTSLPSKAFFKILCLRVSAWARLVVMVSSTLSHTRRRLSIS